MMSFHDFDPYQALMDINQNCQNLFASMKELARAHNASQEQITGLQQKLAHLEHQFVLQQIENAALQRELARIQLNNQKDTNG